MRLTTELNIPIDLNISGKLVFHKEIQIGKITDSYSKDNKLVVTIKIDSKKIKQIKKMLSILTILK